jgi:O-antigen ligase
VIGDVVTRTAGRRAVVMAVVMCAAGVPLLPTNEMKVTGTFIAGVVLLAGICASLWSGEKLQWTALDVPVIAFLVAAVAATVFGVNPRLSLVPSPSRGEGLLDYFVYLPMALAAARLSREEGREVVAVLLSAGGLIGAIGVGQYYGVDVTPWIGSRGFDYGIHSWSTLSNPDFLGGYVALVLPVGLAMAAGARTSGQWWGYASASTLLYAALLASQTRSAWAAVAIASGILLWRLPRSVVAYRRLALLGLAFAAVTMIMAITQPRVSLSGRAALAFNGGDSSMRGRLWIWEHSLIMIRERPMLGWGFSAVQDHLPGIGTPGYGRVFGQSPVVIDVAHNDLLQVSVNMGLLGLAAYLWIWTVILTTTHRATRRPASSPVRPEAAGILTGFIAYLIWLQFLWSHVGDTNVFWVLAGIASTAGGPLLKRQSDSGPESERRNEA